MSPRPAVSFAFPSRLGASLACGLLGLSLLGSAAQAQPAADYPSRAITLIVPFGPGGGVDNIGRRFAHELEARLGQPVVVENRAGAGSVIGIRAAMRAQGDGYTLLLADAALVINALLTDPPPYDFQRDLLPVSLVSSAPYILVTSKALQADTVPAIISKAAAQGSKGLTFASAGVGTAAHMTGELFRLKTGANLTHVPYRSGGPAMTDLVSGQVDMVFTTIAAASPYLAQDRATGVATTGRERLPDLAHLPTLHEQLAGFEVYFWTALFTPPGTSPDIISRLNTATREALASDDMREALRASGNTAQPLSTADTHAFIQAEASMWKEVIQHSGLTSR